MKCPKCQAENKEDAGFCNKCGAKLEIVCPKCGRVNPLGSNFCDKCGQSLGEPTKAPLIDYSQPKSYTPKFLAEKILSARSSLEGERKLVTVLFADVANYTSISEKLDPEEVRQIMDGCFEILLDEIHRYEGTVTQFTGDGAIALFGAPVAHEDHAQRACYAALAIQRALEGYGDRIRKQCRVDFKMRVGLNSGPVIVGSVGNDLKMEYSAVGDTVNLASRMESAARAGAILVSDSTHRMARDFFEFQPLGKLKVKGKEEPVEAYELLKVGEAATRFEAAVARGLTRFVGREKEMVSLREAFEKAQSGSGQVVGIVGEAGVGKSRLLLELRGVLPAGEYAYLEGRCLHYGGAMAYLPFLDVLRSHFNIEEGDREYIIKKKMSEKASQLEDKLKDILPPLQDILSLKVEDEDYLKLDPPLKRVKIFESIRDLLVRESQNKPLVLAIEDLHWIDRTSEEFLDYLIGFLPHTGILLLLLYRPEYTHQWGSKSYYSQIGVDQLSLASSTELVRAMLEGGEVAPELRELILTRAAGNPLFMEEFTHTLLENGTIKKKDHQYVLSRKTSEIQVPDTIQGIIAARMDRLEENLKRTMQVASVIGRDFAYRILQTITGMREELKSYLINLQGLEFIYEKSLFPELEYIFKHALTQEVAYNSLLLKRRKEIHERIGKAIEELYADRLDEFYEMLAHHFSRTENLEKACQYLKLSGDNASRKYSNWEALRFYKEALNVLNQLPQSDENKRRGIQIRLVMDLPMIGLAYPEDSLQILQEGEKLASELGDEKNLAKLHSMIGCCSITQGDMLNGLKYNELAFEEAERIGEVNLIAPIGWDLCVAYWGPGEFLKSAEVARKAVRLVEETQTEYETFGRGFNIYSQLLGQYGFALGQLGDFEGAEAACDKALRFALEINDLYDLGWIEYGYGWVCAIKGDGENAVRHFQNAIRYLEKTQAFIVLPFAWSGLGWGYYFLGDMETALKHVKKAFEMQLDMAYAAGLSMHYYTVGIIQCDLGDLKNAQRNLEKALQLARDNNEKMAEGMARALLGRILAKADISQGSKAETLILQGINILDELKLQPSVYQGYLYLAELYTDTGQSEKAQQIYNELGMDK